MTGQKQTKQQQGAQQRKHNQEQEQTRESENLEAAGEEHVEKVTENIKAAGDVIDDILADFTHTDDQSEVVDASKRPQLREVSAEEFVKAFLQKGGE